MYPAKIIEARDVVIENFELSDLELVGLTLCKNGDVYVWIAYRDRGDYVGCVFTVDYGWEFEDLRAPAAYNKAADSEETLLLMASSALSFADHFTSGRDGEEDPQDWNEHGEYFANHAHGEYSEEDGEHIFEIVEFQP